VLDDLSRRDFTVNAMALEVTSPSPTLIDPHDGLADLNARILRLIPTPRPYASVLAGRSAAG